MISIGLWRGHIDLYDYRGAPFLLVFLSAPLSDLTAVFHRSGIASSAASPNYGQLSRRDRIRWSAGFVRLPITETLGIVASEFVGPVGGRVPWRVRQDEDRLDDGGRAPGDRRPPPGTPEFHSFVITLAIQRDRWRQPLPKRCPTWPTCACKGA
jgi:hypothetical protein